MEYDILGRLTEASRGNKESAVYTYNSDNTVSSLKYGNGIDVGYSYDEARNLTEIFAKNKYYEEVFSNVHTYDNNGNRISKIENDEVTKYSYDIINRLDKVEYPSYIEEFAMMELEIG